MTSNAPVTVSDDFVPGLATQANRSKRYAAMALMAVAGLFSGVVIGVMLAVMHRHVSRVAPLEDASTYASALAYVCTESTDVTVGRRQLAQRLTRMPTDP